MRLISLIRSKTVLAFMLAWGTLAWGSAGAASAQGPGQPDPARPPDKEPWLRINAGGHTGTVQALAFTQDSKRLCSAGLDKVVQVWNVPAIRRDFMLERTIRWQVARGLRGSIFALASAPSDGLLAIGGYGAWGTLGEILLVNPVDGSLVKVLQHHRQTVRSLAFSADGNWLASLDNEGAAALWKRGRRSADQRSRRSADQGARWQPIVLHRPDRDTYGEKWAERIARQPKYRPIVIAGNSHVFVPILKDLMPDGSLRWKLQRISLTNPKDRRDYDIPHQGVVTALAASADGSRLASADYSGNLYIWDLARGTPAARLAPKAVVISLCFSRDGRKLVAGTYRRSDGVRDRSQLQIWDVQGRRGRIYRYCADHVHACAISPDGKRVAYTGGGNYEVFVERLDAGEKPVPLRSRGRRIFKVAFAKAEPRYRIAFGTEFRDRGFNDSAKLEESFDTTRLALGSGAPLKAADWISPQWRRGSWRARQQQDGTLQLLQDDVPRGTIPLDPRVEGRARCYCWIPDRQGNPVAIAVGTDVQNSIYVFRLDPKNRFPILRHFRGHHDFVSSVGVSIDLRYLVSGSADGTVRIWSLAGYERGKATSSRWGAEFEVQKDQAGKEQLVANSVHPAGPLFRRGLRVGDVLNKIVWAAEQEAETDPATIRQKLRDFPWRTQVAFYCSREGKAREPFQLLPAWQPLAALFASTNREWAFWTPSGYYDASANGHRLFGWQVNRGLEKLPDFYRADQFYKNLERPDVMERLLPAGSLHEAFGRAAIQPPAELHKALPEQIAATPRVTILSPTPDTVVREKSVKVRARIEVPSGGKLVQTKVIANGVVATEGKIVEQKDVEGGGKELTYECDAPLPKDEKSMIQVAVGSAAGTTAVNNVVVQREPIPIPPPKLYILAIGIDEYGDPEIQATTSSAADAEAVVERLRNRSKGLYALDEAAVLTNDKVTPELWRESIQRLRKKLKGAAKPDDLLVFFLAGHGIRAAKNGETGQYYYVGHDAKLADLLDKKEYSQCISWNDFRLLADIPCRKVALLDTCHSGAIQPLRPKNLKTAIRELQENVIFTVTASAGKEETRKKEAWRYGPFTNCLLEALDGRADKALDGADDEAPDGIVTLDELVTYVKRAVPQRTENLQHPMAAPDEWLPYAALPLTQAAPRGSQTP